MAGNVRGRMAIWMVEKRDRVQGRIAIRMAGNMI